MKGTATAFHTQLKMFYYCAPGAVGPELWPELFCIQVSTAQLMAVAHAPPYYLYQHSFGNRLQRSWPSNNYMN